MATSNSAREPLSRRAAAPPGGEAFRARYRYRVLIEAEISALKRRFSENIRSREPIARVNEILFKVLCHNICCIIHAATEHGLDLSVMLRADPLEVFKV